MFRCKTNSTKMHKEVPTFYTNMYVPLIVDRRWSILSSEPLVRGATRCRRGHLMSSLIELGRIVVLITTDLIWWRPRLARLNPAPLWPFRPKILTNVCTKFQGFEATNATKLPYKTLKTCWGGWGEVIADWHRKQLTKLIQETFTLDVFTIRISPHWMEASKCNRK